MTSRSQDMPARGRAIRARPVPDGSRPHEPGVPGQTLTLARQPFGKVTRPLPLRSYSEQT